MIFKAMIAEIRLIAISTSTSSSSAGALLCGCDLFITVSFEGPFICPTSFQWTGTGRLTKNN
jgi:hypothetical protein